MKHVLIAVLALLQPVCSLAQTSMDPQTAQSLPAAPVPQQIPEQTPPVVPPNGPQSSRPQPSPPQANPATPTSLSLKDAEALAVKNNPQISVARLAALASEQVTREVRSNLWPSATANLTGVADGESADA